MKKVILFILIIIIFMAFFIYRDKIFLKKDSSVKYKTAGFEMRDSLTEEETLNPVDLLPPDKNKNLNYMDLHFDAIVVDTHNDFIYRVYEDGVSFGKNNPLTHSDMFKLKEGGVDVQIYAVWIPMSKIKRSYSFAVSQIDKLKSFQRDYPENIEFAYNYEDIIRIVNGKKLAALIGIEGGTAIENDLNNINKFYEMGVRYIGLTWNNSNNIASSARDEVERGATGGLTSFGYEVIKRMDDVGMLIDVSHLGEKSFWDVVQTSKNPIIASHSNAYALNPHFRNLTDEQIRSIAQSGGVIQVNFNQPFIDKEKAKFGNVNMEDLIAHIDYIKNLVGIDYVGIGSDYDGGITPPVELYNAARLPLLTKRLVEKGYTEEEIKKVLGLNFLRVFKKVCG